MITQYSLHPKGVNKFGGAGGASASSLRSSGVVWRARQTHRATHHGLKAVRSFSFFPFVRALLDSLKKKNPLTFR